MGKGVKNALQLAQAGENPYDESDAVRNAASPSNWHCQFWILQGLAAERTYLQQVSLDKKMCQDTLQGFVATCQDCEKNNVSDNVTASNKPSRRGGELVPFLHFLSDSEQSNFRCFHRDQGNSFSVKEFRMPQR